MKGESYPATVLDDEHPSEARLDAPPDHPGLVGKSGTDLSRLISLSDGVFAFALTLLALSLTVPVVTMSRGGQSVSDKLQSSQLAFLLQHDYGVFFGYAFAFVMIAIWWIVHQRTFQYIARYNNTLVWLNMAILMQIAIMPFVLNVYSDYDNLQTAVALFAFLQVSLGITTTGLWDYARRRKLIRPNVPESIARFFSRRGWYTSAVFAISIAVTFYSVGLAQVTWFAVFLIPRLLQRHGAPEPV
jgi:uncharacterized membrane protein